MDAAELAARDRQVARPRSAPMASTTASYRSRSWSPVSVGADVDAGAEDRALAAHLVEPPVEVLLLHLELGDAVAQQPADLVGPLVDRDGVTGAGELLGGGQAGRPEPITATVRPESHSGGCGRT